MTAPAQIRHGTAGGARTHYRRGEKPCQACRAAANLAKPTRDPYRAIEPERRGPARNGLRIVPYVYGQPRPAWALSAISRAESVYGRPDQELEAAS